MIVSVLLLGFALSAWGPTPRLLVQGAAGFVIYTALVVAWRVPGISELEALLARRPVDGPAECPTPLGPLDRWRERVRRHGPRSVVDVRHRNADLGKVSDTHWRALLPHFQAELRGGERILLD